MKWLIIQSDGVHRGQDGWSPNWFLRECYSLRHALEVNGETADIWGLRHANFLTPPDFNEYDAVLLVENYEAEWLPDFSQMLKPLKMQWIIDLHYQSWEFYHCLSKHMDLVLHSTKSLIAPYQRRVSGPKHVWFPNAIDDRYFNPFDTAATQIDRSIDALFIGGKGKPREQTIDRMVADVGMTYGYGITGNDYISRLRQAKIGFNKNLAGDINYRTFETIACGACLLTQRDADLDTLGFVDGTNCVLYESDDEAVNAAKELLSSGRWQEIAKLGLELSRRHSYVERVKNFLRQI